MRPPRIDAESRVHDAVVVRHDDKLDVFPVLLDDIVHRRRVPIGVIGNCCFERSTPNLFCGTCATLFVDVPSVGLVAAADDAELADDIVLLGVRWDDREPIGVTLECHGSAPPERLTGGRKATHQCLRHRCRLWSRPAADIEEGFGSPDPRFPGRRFRNQIANSGRGSSASCPRRCNRVEIPCAGI